jgi:3',5'-cyclic AMP phosphodiesterase CpdA
VSVAQLTDTHIVREGTTYFGIDTAQYLADAIDAVNALALPPDYAVITGDIANFGSAAEYARFREIMTALQVPYFVIPGNHDDRDRMRAALPPHTYGGSTDARVRYAVDEFAIRLVGLDENFLRPWPGALLDRDSAAWLERTLAARRDSPTIVAVHQPPFRTGLHYLDVGGFLGRRRLRRIVDRHPQVSRVISGHIHCVRSAQWKGATAISAPSTAPQVLPLLFMEGKVLGIRHEPPGFSLHALAPDATVTTAVYRRDDSGSYNPVDARNMRRSAHGTV